MLHARNAKHIPFWIRQTGVLIGCVFGIIFSAVAAWHGLFAHQLQNPHEVAAVAVEKRNVVVSHDGHLPFQFQFQICNGLTNQKLQILDGILVALFLGAQIVLPKMIVLNGAQFVSVTNLNTQPIDQIFNMSRLEKQIQRQYSDFWCRRPGHRAFNIWCTGMPPSAILYDTSIDVEHIQVENLKLEADEWGPDALLEVGEFSFERVLKQTDWIINRKILRITEPCEFWFHVKVVEGTDFWDEFWKVQDALEFNDQIVELGDNTKRVFLSQFGHSARKKAMKLGYNMDEESIQHGGYHVVHLRAEVDWQHHCEKWFSWMDRRDNCLNNTWQIGNVLLSEGISPTLPVYLATGLSEIDVQDLRNVPSMKNFFNVYTVVTKGMLGLTADVGQDREYWAAVDFILGEDAEWFVGNSISTFSALMMEFRARRKMPILPYNGGKMALEEIDCIRTRALTLVPPARPVIKWLFTLPQNVIQDDVFFNSTMAAVKSALAKSNVIPVCVTAADPNSAVVVRFVSLGVRVIYHTPTWMRDVEKMVQRWNDIGARSGFGLLHPLNTEKVVAQWLRIDLPMLSILDDFVLYTDATVLFTNDVTWKDLFGENHMGLIRSMKRKMFSGPFFNNYASRDSLGVPKFFAVPDNKDKQSGIMLMNLKNLRQSYDEYCAFVIKNEQLLKIDSFDPCSYFEFYEGSALPSHMGWTPYQLLRKNVSVVHFYGPNCQVDILPYLKEGNVRLETYRKKLEICAHERLCAELCAHYEGYLP